MKSKTQVERNRILDVRYPAIIICLLCGFLLSFGYSGNPSDTTETMPLQSAVPLKPTTRPSNLISTSLLTHTVTATLPAKVLSSSTLHTASAATPTFVPNADVKIAETSLITQEFRYHMVDAGEVFFVWGVNGWDVVSEEMRPADTEVDGVMFTPMELEGDTFVAKVQVPAGVSLEYGFQTRKKRDGTPTEEWVWDGDYGLSPQKDGVVEVESTVILDSQLFEDPSDTSMETQEFRYHMVDAGEVFFVWGLNGWDVVSEEIRPAGTEVDGVMFTPMELEGDTFVAKVQVPSDAILNYGFQIRKTENNIEIPWVWDGNYILNSVGNKAISITSDLKPIIYQEIRYHVPEAGRVFLVWGIDGWQTIPEQMRPPGTFIENQFMYTPMARDSDTFVANLQVPSGVTIDYGFLITERGNGAAIESVWDGKESYHIAAPSEDEPVEVRAKLSLTQAKEFVGVFQFAQFFLIALPIVIGIGFILVRGSRRLSSGACIRPRDAIWDCLVLSLIVLLSIVLYIGELGFYSDDWDFLAKFSTAQDQSLIGLFRAAYIPHVQIRPVQILYLSALYWLFGPFPLGYHLINFSVFMLSVVLFYLVLRELGHKRMLAVAVPLVYAFLPHYSTDRFWIAAIQANLSMALYFLSLYSDLRALRASPTHLWGWKFLSIVCLLGSALAYEVAIPLFLLNVLLIWHLGGQPFRLHNRLPRMTRIFVLFGNLFALTAVLAFKGFTATRLDDQTSFLERTISVAKRAVVLNHSDYDYGLNFKQAFVVNYGDYVFGLPQIVRKILIDYPDTTIFVVGGILGLIIFGYLYYLARQSSTELYGTQFEMLELVAWGIIVFVFGYAIFLTNSQLLLTPSGIGNRVAIAAAVGVALSTVGGIGWICTVLISSHVRLRVFCGLVSLLCMGGFLINNTLATFWITAYRQEREILADIQQQFPTLPSGSTLILDGVCEYVGPAIVFESNWDLAGALKMMYDDDSLRADVVTPNLKVKEDGITTVLYGVERQYPYEKTFVYHFGRKLVYDLADVEAARFYFQTYNPNYNNDCSRGGEGHGASVF